MLSPRHTRRVAHLFEELLGQIKRLFGATGVVSFQVGHRQLEKRGRLGCRVAPGMQRKLSTTQQPDRGRIVRPIEVHLPQCQPRARHYRLRIDGCRQHKRFFERIGGAVQLDRVNPRSRF